MPHRYYLYRLDWILMAAALTLLGIGLIVLHAITLKDASLISGFNPTNQIIFALLGLGLCYIFIKLDYKLWFKLAPWFYWTAIVLLGLVLIFGENVQGSTRWIDLGFWQFQPSEFAKIGTIIMLGRIMGRRFEAGSRLRFLTTSLAVAAVPAALVALQPDLGTAAIFGFLWLVMLGVTNINKKFFGALILALLVSIPIVIGNLAPYQQARVETFLNPSIDPQGAGYHVMQSMTAVGSGQLLGRGLSAGSQSQLNFLPSQHTDFIYAVLAEKLGFVGAGLVLVLFGILIGRSFKIAWDTKDNFALLLATGIGAMFFYHVAINIGMNLGIMPVTGIPLPLLSYGGSSLIASLIALGLLQSIYLNRQELEFKT